MPKTASVEIDTPANKGETKIRRSYRAPDRMLERPADGINTMADVFIKAKERKCRPLSATGLPGSKQSMLRFSPLTLFSSLPAVFVPLIRFAVVLCLTHSDGAMRSA